MVIDDIKILEKELKVKENQEIEHFGMASLGILAQQEFLRIVGKADEN